MSIEKRAKVKGLQEEPDIDKFEIALNHANNKSIKNYHGHFRKAKCTYKKASHVRLEKASLADCRANTHHGKMEEARTLLDSGDSGKRQTKTELGKARTAVDKKGTSSEYRADAHNI